MLDGERVETLSSVTSMQTQGLKNQLKRLLASSLIDLNNAIHRSFLETIFDQNAQQ